MSHPKGVLFDFSGTLLCIESTASWLRAALERTGTTLPEDGFKELVRRLQEAGAQPGGPLPAEVPDELAAVWARRDSSAEEHRAAYFAMASRVPMPVPGLYEVLYARHMEPGAWRPYADAAAVLGELRRRGVRTAVVSNVGWDLRPVFREHGLDPLVEAYVLSYEHGVQKPDPRLFHTACDALGLPPQEVLMVGDDAVNDGGAARIGCAVHLVEHLPVDRRPDALLPVLDAVGG
ncbi:HAD family hydrolase [Streptomyces sp. NPDC049555]|uniref:HAD family hydrolase n=1 Tax=Streptomyces sp. NPDC049555 TaxID=3154930 RepID=UPI00342879F1